MIPVRSGVLTNAGLLDAARTAAGRSAAQTVARVHEVRVAPLSRHLAAAAARSLTYARPGARLFVQFARGVLTVVLAVVLDEREVLNAVEHTNRIRVRHVHSV